MDWVDFGQRSCKDLATQFFMYPWGQAAHTLLCGHVQSPHTIQSIHLHFWPTALHLRCAAFADHQLLIALDLGLCPRPEASARAKPNLFSAGALKCPSKWTSWLFTLFCLKAVGAHKTDQGGSGLILAKTGFPYSAIIPCWLICSPAWWIYSVKHRKNALLNTAEYIVKEIILYLTKMRFLGKNSEQSKMYLKNDRMCWISHSSLNFWIRI